MKRIGSSDRIVVKALKVEQWLKEWDKVEFSPKSHRRKPDGHFYLFSLSASQLRALSGVHRRMAKAGERRSKDFGIQRSHEASRSKNIAEFIRYGYPWSDLTMNQRQHDRFNDLRKPGWLPTAVVVNILTKDDMRGGQLVAPEDLVQVDNEEGEFAKIALPAGTSSSSWRQHGKVRPIEIIDGQHRLLAFDDLPHIDYELPVVAFHGLDISWQAYLFWTINIKPKRINPSLAFDLYPLLRTEAWLERFEGHRVYREARAQELVEILWSERESAWYQRINMLGESGSDSVTQAAWIRALLKSYVKSFEGRGVAIGGLFGAPVGVDEIALPWNRNQQAALLIYTWNQIKREVERTKASWAQELRNKEKQEYRRPIQGDAAFAGPFSLLNNDQGVTVVLNVTNDLLFTSIDKLALHDWRTSIEDDMSAVLRNLNSTKRPFKDFVDKIAVALADFDWRTSGAKGLTEMQRTEKLSYRGGSGYREFRRVLLKHLKKHPVIAPTASRVYRALGFGK